MFNPLPRRVQANRLGGVRASAIICQIGEAAGVKVHTDSKSGKVKFASAHDLRRSFGERWAARVMPQVLMELMRHEDISTTMKYYVGRNAERTADVLWEAHKSAQFGNTFGNTRDFGSKENLAGIDESRDADKVLSELPGKDLNLE